jgi:hypothetical protein
MTSGFRHGFLTDGSRGLAFIIEFITTPFQPPFSLPGPTGTSLRPVMEGLRLRVYSAGVKKSAQGGFRG